MRFNPFGRKKWCLFLFIVFTAIGGRLYSQTAFSEDYKKGIKAISEGKQEEAENYFKSSILSNKDAPSYYRLGKLQLEQNSYKSRNDALENLKQASLRMPENLTYRIEYLRLLEDFAIYSAVSEYKSLIAEYPKCKEALIRLGEICLKGFNDYKNSKKIAIENEAKYDFNLSELAKQDYLDAEKYFAAALNTDSLCVEAFYGLSRLYEGAKENSKAINLFKKIIGIDPANKNAHLFLGMVYHRMGKEDEAGSEFDKALGLMSYDEREDFVYNSAKMIIEPVYKDELKSLSREDIEATLERFWKVTNPLLLSGGNTRLLEHYSRMAYANLYFGLPKKGIDGWKTDRGEVLLRYGEPQIRITTRPYISGSGSFSPKNDIWNYENFTLTFDDYSMDGNFKFSWDRGNNARFGSSLRSNIDSFEDFERIKKESIQMYKPAGKTFEIDKEIYCFRNPDNKNEYDSYLAFTIPVFYQDGSLMKNNQPFETGIFVFDRYFNSISEKRSNYGTARIMDIINEKQNPKKIDVIKFNLPADTASLAFEARRLSDSTYYSYHSLVSGPDFKKDSLDLSDIVLASNLESGVEIKGALKRGDIYITPFITNKFNTGDKAFIYYEVYNLAKDQSGSSEFEQTITLKTHINPDEGGVKKFLRGIKNMIFGEGSRLSLTSSYQTKELNPQQYMQIDFSGQEPGTYDLTIEVRDKKTGIVTSKTLITEIEDSGKKK